MTPDQLFQHRLGSLLGLSIYQVESLSHRELNRWRKYWTEEPWGAWRDNMHIALVIQQLLRPHLKDGTDLPPIREFMFMLAEDKSEADRQAKRMKYLAALRAKAKRK